MSNADCIRVMSDEELSMFLWEVCYGGHEPWASTFKAEFCDRCELHNCGLSDEQDCPHGADVAWWLRQPVKEERNEKADPDHHV